ncbi:tyrosine-type recombinase/integrase [Deinococcus hopiensis]|uniref:tyrosine-type recombinase/integrase n=1 Tax=Deinococcus hopiensis TaxID=309885 RepID=UPI0014831310|nr:tyrosine-type recombinase/integrase [Deinococcus hopiensis]
MLAHTGVRIDETLSLGWRGVDLGEDDARLVVRSGKGRKSREVPVSPRRASHPLSTGTKIAAVHR